jgi:hypothetical protein
MRRFRPPWTVDYLSSFVSAAKKISSNGGVMNTGLLGELQVEERLVENGWHPIRLDTAQMASNADLLAINRRQRVSIQVKTTNGSDHSHADALMFGYARAYLRDGATIFNSKQSPIVADVVVGVNYRGSSSRFVVMPVSFAETLCKLHCDYVAAVPKKAGGNRSVSFPIYLSFIKTRSTQNEHHHRMQRNLLAYENAWHVLLEAVDKLHDANQWPLVS